MRSFSSYHHTYALATPSSQSPISAFPGPNPAKMLRSLPRVACNSSASLLASTTTRRSLSPILSTPAACLHATRTTTQHRHAHAISNPTLAGIEKRWEAMPPQEQAELWMALRDRMKADWHELTLQEKKAGTFHTLALRSRVPFSPLLHLHFTKEIFQ